MAPLVVQGCGDHCFRASATLVPDCCPGSPLLSDAGSSDEVDIDTVACVRDAADPIVDMLALAQEQHAEASDALEHE